MTLTFSTNKSPKNKLEKELELVQSCTSCQLKAPCDIINPVFTVSTISAADLYKCNYVYAPELNGRKYFITDILKFIDYGNLNIEGFNHISITFGMIQSKIDKLKRLYYNGAIL